MAKTQKALNEELRAKITKVIFDFLQEQGEDVQMTASNKMMFPTIDEEQNDAFAEITVKIPTGSRDGEGYDGYEQAEEYKMKCEEQAKKKAEQDKKKAEKIAKDKAQREAKAKAKAEREAQKLAEAKANTTIKKDEAD